MLLPRCLLALSVVAVAVDARRSYGPDWEQLYGGPGPSGSNNPVVSPNSTVAQELQEAFANGPSGRRRAKGKPPNAPAFRLNGVLTCKFGGGFRVLCPIFLCDFQRLGGPG
jgi:hypothetical protein